MKSTEITQPDAAERPRSRSKRGGDRTLAGSGIMAAVLPALSASDLCTFVSHARSCMSVMNNKLHSSLNSSDIIACNVTPSLRTRSAWTQTSLWWSILCLCLHLQLLSNQHFLHQLDWLRLLLLCSDCQALIITTIIKINIVVCPQPARTNPDLIDSIYVCKAWTCCRSSVKMIQNSIH